jgi:hypothetical protein
MSKEAMKLALEALKSISEMVDYEGNGFKLEYEIKALEEALAKQEQGEPVAYFNPQVKGGFYWAKPTKITAPVTVSVEPMPLYTTPQQRTWVGLTDEEREEIALEVPMDAVCITEAKLKEKNNA